jgi:hypothetical protein
MTDDKDDKSDNAEPAFELIGKQGELNGLLRLRYGSSPNDSMPFILTLTPQYVARELKKTPPLAFAEITKYAEQNADKLKGIASFQKQSGYTTHTLD